MSARRLVGLETEYGIIRPDMPRANSTVLSAQVVDAFAQLVRQGRAHLGAARWDYSDESPLADARGYQVRREDADPSQLTDVEPTVGDAQVWDAESVALEAGDARVGRTLYQEHDANEVVMNMVLGNGARLYVDHAHPEYSSPEVTSPRDAVLWDQAGDEVMRQAIEQVRLLGGSELLLYKNNTDNKSVSYGAHENYLVPRVVAFDALVAGLTPFFVTRQVFCGSGRVGRGQLGTHAGFQLSQRADFFEAEVGLETTVNRPIINTRDEPHASWEKHRRLHVIIGDANLGQVATLLRVGTTNLVLSLIEAGAAPRLELADPVTALRAVSHDTSLTATVKLRDGRKMSAIDIQGAYLDAAEAYCAQRGIVDPDTTEILTRWRDTLQQLATDPAGAAATVDWIAKHQLMSGFAQRHSVGFDDARIALMDLQWADLRREKGLYYRLAARGRMETLFDDAQIAAAVHRPPGDTRAFLRGMVLQRYPEHIITANWDALSFSLPGARRLHRVTMPEPLAGNRAELGALFDAQLEIEQFVAELAKRQPAGGQ